MVLETRHGLLVEALVGRGVHGAAGQPGPGGAPPRPGEEEGRQRGRADLLP